MIATTELVVPRSMPMILLKRTLLRQGTRLSARIVNDTCAADLFAIGINALEPGPSRRSSGTIRLSDPTWSKPSFSRTARDGRSGPRPISPTASAALPAGAYTTLRTYGGDGVSVPRRSRRGGSRNRPPCRPAGRRSIAGACAPRWPHVLRATRHPESRIRVTFAPPDLFASIEPFAPLPEHALRGPAPGASRCRCGASSRRPRTRGSSPPPRRAYRRAARRSATRACSWATDGALLEGLSSNLFAVVGRRAPDRRRAGPARHDARRSCSSSRAGSCPVSFEAIRRADLGRVGGDLPDQRLARGAGGRARRRRDASAAGSRERWRRS